MKYTIEIAQQIQPDMVPGQMWQGVVASYQYVCKTHGIFEQSFRYRSKSHGCSKCYAEKCLAEGRAPYSKKS